MRKLRRIDVERPWGRRTLPAPFERTAPAVPIGEIWFTDEAEQESELLVKYLFTADRLSVQVHPDDAAARAAGYKRGKDEAWVVLDAEPGAVIGIGLTHAVSVEELRSAALDGSIESLLAWREVGAGDAIYAPAGTIHAIGGGLSLVEIQQNLDVTYRLYDYGRPRELHLDAALAVARRQPSAPAPDPVAIDGTRSLVAAGPALTVERWRGEAEARIGAGASSPLVLVPLSGTTEIAGRPLDPGSVWTIEGEADLSCGEDCDLLVSSTGPIGFERR